jgi:hypothetical protein
MPRVNPVHRERVVTTRGTTPPEPRTTNEESPPESIQRELPRPEGSRERGLPTPIEESEPWLTERPPAFDPEEAEELSGRWTEIASAFIDSPRIAVAQADELVGEVIERLMKVFNDERAMLHRALEDGSLTTEDLRLALRRYHALFDRVLIS